MKLDFDGLFAGEDPDDISDFEKAIPGLLYHENDFRIVKFLGKGSFGAIFDMYHRKHTSKRFAGKIEIYDLDRVAKLFVRPLGAQFLLSSEHTVPCLGYCVLDYDNTVKLLERKHSKHLFPDQQDQEKKKAQEKTDKEITHIAVLSFMELGNRTLEHKRIELNKKMEKDLSRKGTKEENLRTQRLREVLPIAKALLKCLQHMHAKNVLHRDFKMESKSVLLFILFWRSSSFLTSYSCARRCYSRGRSTRQ